MIETHSDISGDLNMLFLIVAYRYFFGVIQQNIGCLQGRVSEKPGRYKFCFTLRLLIFKLRHSA